MNGEPSQNPLRELLWRRKLTQTERSELRAQPETQADLELESSLTEVLDRLPNAAAPSNFTSRVLQAIEREELQAARKWSGHWWNWRLLLPRVAVAAAAVMMAGLTIQHHELKVHRTQLAQSVALAQPMPSVEALKNFDAIQRMSQPHADEQLLALLR